MSMDKMMASLLNKDQDEFNTAFDMELKSRLSEKMPNFIKSISSGLLNTPDEVDHTEPESLDTINTTEQ